MDLDWKVCSRARLSRDPRFDGKFFIGVRTSGVYCRPICPAPTAKEKNVRYFPTAAAAAEAGFRPCLRCRPECSPGTPAWLGTPATVSRALRLIAESGLEDGVEGLAQRLGIGARHLRRLFLQHLGAPPSAVAHTRRLHFAKKLIDETRLNMSEIAVAAGFGCVRRFNAAVHKVYKRSPTQIRRLARQNPVHQEDEYVFRLRFRPPYHWTGMLNFLAARATPGVELVESGKYRRSISIRDHQGYFEVAPDEKSADTLQVRVQFPDPRALFFIIERVRTMFDVNADWTDIALTLESDRLLRKLVKAGPGLRLPGCWDPFELTVRAILGQQISVKGATTLAGRITQLFGQPFAGPQGISHLFPKASTLAKADLTSAGLTKARAATIQTFARAVCSGQIRFEGIVNTGLFLSGLCEIPGIGTWTAQYVAMRALGESDAFPSSDLGLLRCLNLKNPRELERRAESWRPWRSYAAMYLWCFGSHEQAGQKLSSRQAQALSEHYHRAPIRALAGTA